MRRIKKIVKWLIISIACLFFIIGTLCIVFNQQFFSLIPFVGTSYLYYGNNEKGNTIINYALSKIENPSAELYHEISVQNTKNGNYNLAVKYLEKAMQLDPKEVSAYYGWVLLYYYHDYEKALAILEKCDAYTPNFSDAPMGEDIHYLKGLCHMQLARYTEAIEEFNCYINNLISTHGEDYVDVYTFVQKGRCLTNIRQFDEAILAYKKAIMYYEDCTEAYYFMGLTHIEMNQKNNASICFQEALVRIKKGIKSSDNYVAYFHEIYLQQIEESIAKNYLD